jgi:N-terminal TM domain of oligopeptide transport permease C
LTTTLPATTPTARPVNKPLRRFFRNPGALVGAAIALVLIVLALLAHFR